jgi:phosphatidylglycerophosphate synthase
MEQASQNRVTFGQRVVSVFPDWVTPNHLTYLRMACSLAMLVLELYHSGLGVIIILGLIAGFSDLLDGALARARGLVTELGAFLDPLSDKLFAIVLMVIVWRRDLAEPWLLLLILVTEVHTVLIPLMSLLRRRRQGRDLWPPPKVEPNQLGKLKTFLFAFSLGFSIIGAWLGWNWLISFCWFNIWVALALGIGGEVIYLRDYARGAYA